MSSLNLVTIMFYLICESNYMINLSLNLVIFVSSSSLFNTYDDATRYFISDFVKLSC